MNRATTETAPAVPAEEVERRIAEYRRLGFERQAPAHVVYHPPHHPCPWPGCGHRIAGIGFELDRMGEATQRSQWMEAWWQGPGLVGACPGCGRHVLFALSEKRAVTDVVAMGSAVLPEDWYRKAHVLAPANQQNGGGQ